MPEDRTRWPIVQRLAGLLVAATAVATVATSRGRTVSTDNFLLLRTVFLPAATLAAAAALARPTPSRRRWQGPVLAVAAAVTAFEAGRVLSTFWLLWGRGIRLDVPFLAAAGVALVALAAGCVLVAAGTRAEGPARARSRARWCLFGVVAVPLIPWLVLVGGGTGAVTFNDLTDPAFSSFPVRGPMAAGLWTLTVGLGLAGASAALRQRSTRLDRWGTGLGVLAVAVGYAVYGWQTWVLNGAFPAGRVLPLANYVPLAAAVVAWIKLRGVTQNEVAFRPQRGPSERDR